jgi:hypothetical protein
VVANVSISSLNLSLLVNTVGFYQARGLHALPVSISARPRPSGAQAAGRR